MSAPAETKPKHRSGRRRPFHGNRWFIVDQKDHVRAQIRRCFRGEAAAIAPMLFGNDETFRVLRYEELSLPQRREITWSAPLTPQKCAALLGGMKPIDADQRKQKMEEIRAKYRAEDLAQRIDPDAVGGAA